jgi:uncharacterized protein YbjT (DUF2867 family)
MTDKRHEETVMKVAVAGGTGRVGRHAVELLEAAGHEVVAISRSKGVDVITGDGLAEALVGVEAVIDATTGPSPEQQAATEFFETATRNLHEAGRRAGVQRLVVVSIIGVDRFASGYGVAKIAHEQAALTGPIPTRILRAAQFHELVEQLLQWGTQGDVAYVPRMRTQLVAARTVAEELLELTTGDWSTGDSGSIPEIAGPREESLVEAATLFSSRRGLAARVEGVSDPSSPDAVLQESGGLLPGPAAKLAGPTFGEWLDRTSRRLAA